MNKNLENVLIFVLSFILMSFGILFFIGISNKLGFGFTEGVILVTFGWITFHSFVLVNSILARYLAWNIKGGRSSQ